MKAQIGAIALLVGILAVPYSFATATPKAETPRNPAVEDVGKMFGEAMTSFKKEAGHPSATGTCDRRDGNFAADVVLYTIEGTDLFEIKNSGKKFFHVSSNRRPLTLFQEKGGKLENIPLSEMDAVLGAAGASEFLKSIDPSNPPSDCVVKMFKQGTSI